MITKEKLNGWFDICMFPEGESFAETRKIKEIVEAGSLLAEAVLMNTWTSADQSHSVRHIRDAVHSACQAVILERNQQR